MIRFENSKGVKNRRAKLTPEIVAEMRRRRDAGEKPKEIVKDYDTTWLRAATDQEKRPTLAIGEC